MTQLVISVAKFPGKEGEKFHNRHYEMFGLNYRYVALPAKNIKEVLEGVRSLGIKGCSVAHPFKMEAVQYLDEKDTTVKQTGAVNTILNDGEKLIGYNTDIVGAQETLKVMDASPTWNVAILGEGGASRAVVQALKNLHIKNYTIYSRKSRNWEERIYHKGDLLINATSVGMEDKQQSPYPLTGIRQFKNYFDVIPHVTILQAQAAGMGVMNQSGALMKRVQAEKQFEIYTGIKI